ncbi:MAG: DUF3558 domain-containing protein [Actinophytocola sp.]|nr:DUF3558 domain-containing protein [Actinophytocola sp.]
MRIKRVPVLFAVLAVAFSAAACSEQTKGSPTGGAIVSPSAGDQVDVPQVEVPLNANPFLKRPCDLVEDSVLSELGDFQVPNEDVNSDAAKKLIGPRCNWHAKNHGPDVGLAINTVHRDNGTGGIKGVYDGKEAGLIDRLEPVKIPGNSGYPAAFAGGDDEFSRGRCPLAVGITNELSFTVSVTNRERPKQACSAVLKVAASVLDTLKKGS